VLLIVSFIGHADLRAFGLSDGRSSARSDEEGPIQRLLRQLRSEGKCLPGTARLTLFDDTPKIDLREQFRQTLKERLPEIGLAGLTVGLQPLELAGPTDLDGLYQSVRRAVLAEAREADGTVFNLSAGTPAMYGTLLLVANSLPSDQKVLLYESSPERDVVEVQLPYVIAAREKKSERAGGAPGLSTEAENSLLRDTVVEDPLVEAAYACLYNEAKRRRPADSTATVLMVGASGSGKWHAARQFAHWRGGEVTEWLDPSMKPGADAAGTVLVRRVESWPREALFRLSAWRLQHPGVAMAATFRCDVQFVSPLDMILREALHGAAHVSLPPLSGRSDRIELAETMARRVGLWHSTLRERLGHDLLVSEAENLHELQGLLATAAARSETRHADRAAYIQARQLADVPDCLSLLDEAHQVLKGLKFGRGRPSLKEVLEAIEVAVVRYAQAGGRTQKQAGSLLGYARPQQTVSEIIARRMDFRQWRTRLAASEQDEP
jgi:hypothetical protein